MLTMQRILVPVDFSTAAVAALDYADALARRFDAEVVVLHVWEMPILPVDVPDLVVVLPNEPRQTLRSYVEQQAGRALDRLVHGREGLRIRTRLELGPPAETILEIAASERVDAIVTGTHGRRGLARLALGSVAEKVLRRSTCPVIVIRREDEG